MRRLVHRSLRVRSSLAAVVLVAVAAGCSTTQQVKVDTQTQNYCPFLGAALCAQLTETDTPGRLS